MSEGVAVPGLRATRFRLALPSLLNLLKKFGMAAGGSDDVASGALEALQTGNLSVVAMSMADENGGNQELDR